MIVEFNYLPYWRRVAVPKHHHRFQLVMQISISWRYHQQLLQQWWLLQLLASSYLHQLTLLMLQRRMPSFLSQLEQNQSLPGFPWLLQQQLFALLQPWQLDQLLLQPISQQLLFLLQPPLLLHQLLSSWNLPYLP